MSVCALSRLWSTHVRVAVIDVSGAQNDNHKTYSIFFMTAISRRMRARGSCLRVSSSTLLVLDVSDDGLLVLSGAAWVCATRAGRRRRRSRCAFCCLCMRTWCCRRDFENSFIAWEEGQQSAPLLYGLTYWIPVPTSIASSTVAYAPRPRCLPIRYWLIRRAPSIVLRSSA